MIDLSKNISLFISESDFTSNVLSGLISFLSEEYNLLCVSFRNPVKTTTLGSNRFGKSSMFKNITVNPDDYQEQISENLFRVDVIIISLSYNLSNYKEFFHYLNQLNLTVFILVHDKKSVELLKNCDTYFRNFYYVSESKEYWKNLNIHNRPSLLDRYTFKNISTNEEFTISQYKASYIRDKKIDIFLDNDDEKI